jgi:hypothetical protein
MARRSRRSPGTKRRLKSGSVGKRAARKTKSGSGLRKSGVRRKMGRRRKR